MEPGTFNCTICGDVSRHICVYCTKDTCGNHRCERCERCSDCCECEVPRNEFESNGYTANHVLLSPVSLFSDPDEPAQ
jgi:hypothetical protein